MKNKDLVLFYIPLILSIMFTIAVLITHSMSFWYVVIMIILMFIIVDRAMVLDKNGN